MTDASGSYSYSYGNLDELLSATTTYTGLSAKTISYAYYPNGSRQTMTTPAGTFSYYYDAAGRPASMSNPFSETTSWTYQDNDWLATQTLANGATATYTYNALGQVTRLLNQISSNTISDFTSLGYDGVGNRTSLSASVPGATSLNGTTGYTYDTKDQVTQETSTRNGGFTDNFGYYSAGNPTTFKGATKTYNSKNQETASGFTYDFNGNPIAYNGVSLTFDPENRLISYGSVLTAGYRGDGLRGKKQTASGTTYFLYDETNPVIEMDVAGSVAATNTFSNRGVISRRVGTVSVLYAFDSEGNVSQRTDASGAVLSNHLFAAHGVNLSGGVSDPFSYKAQFGYYSDAETGLQLLTNRYYDASTGRFVTRDPISYSGGINLYASLQNNSSNLVDPTGLIGVIDWEALDRKLDRLILDYGPGPSDTAGAMVLAGVAVVDGPQPGPTDALVAGYLILYCLAAMSNPVASDRVVPGPWPGSGPISTPKSKDEPKVQPAPPPPPGDPCVEAYEACIGWANQAGTATERHMRLRLCAKAYDECKAGGITVKFPHGGVVR